METPSKEQILNIVDRCFHMYASDYRNDARIYATEMLEEITKPIKSDQTQIEKLEADKSELLEALEIAKQSVSNSVRDEIESLIQKHKK